MAMLTDAVMAVWNDVVPEVEPEFNEWYIRDHLPDRVSLPGFERGRRWIAESASPRYFTFYEIDDVSVMHSDVYLDRHENPTAWTSRIMPSFVGMNRSICRVTAKRGGADGGVAGVVRLTPEAGAEDGLRTQLAGALLPTLLETRGVLAACLWELDREASRMPVTAETRLRATTDAVIDWALVIEAGRVDELQAAGAIAGASLTGAGAGPESAGAASVAPLETYRLLGSLRHDRAAVR